MAEIKYGARRPVVLQVREPSMGMIQLGKIVPVYPLCRWAYVNNLSAEMRKTAEIAVAPCVVSIMQAWQAETIYYYDSKGGTYHTSLKRLLERGQLKQYSYRPAYYHMAIKDWERRPDKVQSKYTEDTMVLEWESPEVAAQPAQLALSF